MGGPGQGGGIGAFASGFRGFDCEFLGVTRKFGAQELRFLLLQLLAEKPNHGYELMKAIEERSSGYYVPSPGMIYPALTYLEKSGYVIVEAEGTRKLYHLTEEGHLHLERNREVVDTVLTQLDRIARKVEQIRWVLGTIEACERGAEDHRLSSIEVTSALRDLKSALYEKRHCSAEETRRIAEAIWHAVANIRGR
jgi:DNA-binding PadR family transcriptional regulator